MFLLAHISDIHLAPLPSPRPAELIGKRGLGWLNWLRKRRSIHRRHVLDALTADLAAQQPDHVAVTGDLVNLSLGNEFVPARRWLEALAGPRDASFVPGNHDAYVRPVSEQATAEWGDYMRGDAGEPFPYVRRRDDGIAIIGVSSAVPTPPLAATGEIGATQLAELGNRLAALGREGAFRVVLVHHAPIDGVHHFRRLRDAPAFRDVLRKHGAELVLHGHLHESSLIWLAGPYDNIPCAGAPSASSAPGSHDEPAGYHLFEIAGGSGDWHCSMATRSIDGATGSFAETGRQMLY
jgi:3',5'-cyclic AMP phosphodiesterase CpdA